MTYDRFIGGEMEIHPSDFSRQGTGSIWPDFGKISGVTCDTGRSAFRVALRDWRQRSGGQGRVWLPHYLCHSMAQAVTNEGLRYVQYQDHPGVQTLEFPPAPNDDDLVVMVHYFGMVNRTALDWLSAYPRRNWQVLEDCVQAPYSDGAGRVGDYVIVSLRKWWPVPDGAILCSDLDLSMHSMARPDEEFVGHRLAAQLLRGTGSGESLYLDWIKTSENQLENAPPRAPSWLSRQLLSSIDVAAGLARRLDNWRFVNSCLVSGLAERAGLSSLYKTLPPGTIPLALPVRVTGNRRDRLRTWLVNQRIYCPIHWQLPDSAPDTGRNLSKQILSLPIDQRYDEEDMARMTTAIAEFTRKETRE